MGQIINGVLQAKNNMLLGLGEKKKGGGPRKVKYGVEGIMIRPRVFLAVSFCFL